MAKILIVDDDQQLVEMIKLWFRKENHVVESADNGFEALNLMRSFGFDVIVLDWELPGLQGPDIAKKYRDEGFATPILMLTARKAIEEKERGFNCGADDYLTKPFHPKELALRVRSLLNRTIAPVRNNLTMGQLSLDFSLNKVTINGEELRLTAKEFALLEFLLRHPEQVFSVDALIGSVWNSEAEVTVSSVRMAVSRLREKLEGHTGAPVVDTVPNFGYRIIPG